MSESKDAPVRRSPINLQFLAAASIFASKEETRYYLNGVYVEISERSTVYVATDGARLIAIRDDRLLSDEDSTLTGAFIVPTAQCRAFKLAKEGPFEGTLTAVGSRLTISFDRIDVSFSPIDGIYPDWRRVVPRDRATGQPAHFNYKLLADFQKFGTQLGFGMPSIAPSGVEAPALVWFPGHYEAVGVMMPLRNQDETGRDLPDWILSGPVPVAA